MNRKFSADKGPPSKRALILVGHGSTRFESAKTTTEVHAAAIATRGIYRIVRTAYLLGKPSLNNCLDNLRANHVVVVPNFACDGYLSRTVIPEVLNLTGGTTERIGPTGWQGVRVTEAVGSHPLLDHIALARISDVGRKLRLPPEELDVVVVGHGTTKSRESFRATNRVAAKILAARLANQATALFLDEKPGLDEWRDLTTKRNVVVLPFLMSLGKHCGEDIPKLLGLNERNPVLRETLIRGAAPFGPETVADRRLWLCPPIGADPAMTEIILDRAGLRDYRPRTKRSPNRCDRRRHGES